MAAASASSTSSTYLSTMFPETSGGKCLQVFTEEGDKAIDVCLGALRGVRDGSENQRDDYKLVFPALLGLFYGARHSIAIMNKTPAWQHFGRDRLDIFDEFSFTSLLPRYPEFNARMTDLFMEILKGSIPPQGDPANKEFLLEGNYKERRCSFQVELLTQGDIEERHWHLDVHPDIKKAFPKDRILQQLANSPSRALDLNHRSPNEAEKARLEQHHKVFQHMKKYPAAYSQMAGHYMVEKMKELVPEKNSLDPIYVSGKVRIQIGNKMVALSQYFIRIDRDGKSDPVQQIKNAVVLILHQDKYLIKLTLEEVTSVFAKAMMLDMSQKGAAKLLSREIATVRYLFAHAMPIVRGAAAVGEWTERMGFKFHGIECTHSSETTGDLEALTAPLYSTFMRKAYKKTVTLRNEQSALAASETKEKPAVSGDDALKGKK